MLLNSLPFKGWRVHVENLVCDRLNEYDTYHTKGDKHKGPTSTSYLECREGQEFKIVVTRPAGGRENGVAVNFRVDGRLLDGFTSVKSKERTVMERGTMFSEKDGQQCSFPLKFEKLRVTDNRDKAQKDEDILDEIGTIVVSLHLGRVEGTYQSMPQNTLRSIGELDERAKKGLIGSCVGAGEGIPVQTPETYSQWMSYNDERDDHTFIFKYRSRQLLVAQGIIEPAPSDQRFSGKRKASPSNAAQSSSAVKKIKQEHFHQVKMESVAQEGNTDEEDDDDFEDITELRSKEAAPIEIVDLTHDDD